MMLLSHVAVGFVGKKIAPKVSLGTLIIAALLADFVWIVLTFLGIEHYCIVSGITLVSSYDMYDTPFSHGFLANGVIALVFGGVYYLIKKDRRSAMVLGFVVLSHWILDFIAHRPDMVILTNAGPHVGLELWRSYWGTFIIEIGLYIIGLVIYISASKARRKIAFVPLILLVLYSGLQFFASLFMAGPDKITIGFVVVSLIIFCIWYFLSFWTDALRTCESMANLPLHQ